MRTTLLLLALVLASCMDVGDDESSEATVADCPTREERAGLCEDQTVGGDCCTQAGEDDCFAGLVPSPTWSDQCVVDYCTAYCAAGCWWVAYNASATDTFYCACDNENYSSGY